VDVQLTTYATSWFGHIRRFWRHLLNSSCKIVRARHYLILFVLYPVVTCLTSRWSVVFSDVIKLSEGTSPAPFTFSLRAQKFMNLCARGFDPYPQDLLIWLLLSGVVRQ